MADALCGPSNPLHSFQKHTSADRSLQQDRLASRAGPSQGFRSEPGPSAGILDPEFEAFQAGLPPSLAEPQIPHARPQHFFEPSFAHQPTTVDWAADFQRLNLSHPPQAAPYAQAQQGLQRSTAWHDDFQRQQQPSPVLQQRQNYPSFTPRYNHTTAFALNQPHQTLSSGLHQEASSEPVQEEFDASAFEREFEAHAAELLRQEDEVAAATRTVTELGQDVVLDDDLNMEHPIITGEGELAHIANEQPEIHHEQPAYDEPGTDEDLARTAGEILERVSDNTSQKFRESSFLSLMTRLRDREVKVEGNQIVDIDNGSGGKTIPSDEQDDDPGRDKRMAGALQSSEDTGQGAVRNEEDRKAIRRQLLLDGLYPGHMVDDF